MSRMKRDGSNGSALRVGPASSLAWNARRFAPQEGQRGRWPCLATAPAKIVAVMAMCMLLASAGRAAEWAVPDVRLPQPARYPVVACTPEELIRLKAAYAGTGAAHDAVSRLVDEADAAIKRPLVFPPRGGQHNQWYQCEACQTGLKTIDDTHHQCPKCKKIYSGEPYDDVIFGRVHYANLRGASAAAWAYAITGKKGCAEHAAKVLLGYAERYRGYPLHSADRRQGASAGNSAGRLAEQTLNEAEMMAHHVAPAYDLIHDSGVLSPPDDAAIREGLLLPMLDTIGRNKAGKGNWQTWHNAAMIWGGAVVGDSERIRNAIADPRNGFAFQMGASVMSDGMWFENSWGYHFYTLDALVLMAEGSRRIGVDLWSHPALRKMFTLSARYAMADGSLPRFGDDARTSARSGGSLMECAWHAYKDPAIGGLLSDRVSWESVLLGRGTTGVARAPVNGSEVFTGAGHAILRTEGPAGLSAALTFGPYGGFHGHFDKLSFVFFGYGKELGVDPGRAASQAYRLPIHTRWYKSTLGHNAVLVDGASQAAATGKLELFAATPTHAAVVASCDAAYPGVRQRRLLCMTPNYLLVFDDLSSASERRFDWLYHNRGSSVRCETASQPGKLGETYAGQEYVENVKTGTTDQTVLVEFPLRELTTRLTVAAERGTEVRVGDGVGASVMDRVPLAMITRRGRTTRFAAVIEPVADAGRAAVTGVTVEAVAGGTQIIVRAGDAVDEVLLAADGSLKMSRAGQILLSGRPMP